MNGMPIILFHVVAIACCFCVSIVLGTLWIYVLGYAQRSVPHDCGRKERLVVSAGANERPVGNPSTLDSPPWLSDFSKQPSLTHLVLPGRTLPQVPRKNALCVPADFIPLGTPANQLTGVNC